MKSKFTSLLTACAMFAGLPDTRAEVLWESFNDHRPGATTAANASSYDMKATGEGGVLRNIENGADLPVTLVVEVDGASADDFGANGPVNPGSPADLLFANKCTIGNDGIPGVRNSGGVVLRLRFTGLNPANRYKFRGTSSRAGNYNDRWAVFKIVEADGSVVAHVDGSANLNLFTATSYPPAAAEIGPDEVALNSGDNKAGSLVGWDTINPGADGEFAVEARQYVGPAPFGNPAAGPYGYGFSAIYLAEEPATGTLVLTANPLNRLVPAGTVAQFTVTATSPNPISYRWQSTAPGGDVFEDVPGTAGASATYTTPLLTVSNDNTKFRCRVTAGTDTAISGEAVLRVDGVRPGLATTTGSTNLNAIYLGFSEPMTLAALGTAGNYSVDGGLTISAATVLDSQTVKLSTSAHTPRREYHIQVNNVTDVAGNTVAPGTPGSFTGFDIVPGVVSVEIWSGVTGDLASFLADPRFPGSPDRDFAAPSFDSTTVWPDGPNNTYGGRMRAWITPPETLGYNFFLRSDNVSELRISTDDSFANLGDPIASDTDGADGFQEPGSTGATSAQIGLVAGRRYAIEVVWEEDNGADFAALAWRDENDSTPADQLLPVSGSVLSFYGPPALPVGTITNSRIEGGQFIVEWTGPGVLQTSVDLLNWQDQTGAISPFSTPATPPRKFARLRP